VKNDLRRQLGPHRITCVHLKQRELRKASPGRASPLGTQRGRERAVLPAELGAYLFVPP
jgi:hypothetical protein